MRVNDLLRLYHTVKHIPPQRHLDRLVNRGKRLVYRLWPESARRYFLRAAAAKGDSTLELGPLEAAAARWLALSHGQSASCIFHSSAQLDVTLAGVTYLVDVDAPYLAESPADEGYLWRRALGYLAYIAPRIAAGDAECVEPVLRMLRAWASPAAWKAPGIFDYQWHPYAASHRLANCLLAFGATTSAGRFIDDGEREEYTRLLALQAAFIRYNPEAELQYNHLAKNYFALALYEVATTGFVSQSTAKQFSRSIQQQVLPDGCHAELCPMYHNAFLADLLVLLELGEPVVGAALFELLQATISKMQSAACAMSFTNGQVALFGDSWYGEAPTTEQLLGEVRGLRESRTLSQAGYVKLCAAPLEVIIDGGPCGPDDNPGHAHDDFMAIEVAIAGRRVIVDYGVESYARGAARTRTRHNTRHNAPVVAGISGLELWDNFRVGRRAKAPQRREHTNGIELTFSPLTPTGVVLERKVTLAADRSLAIEDTWQNLPTGSAPRLTFLLPQNAWHCDGEIRLRDTGSIGENWILTCDGNRTIAEGCFFNHYGVAEKAWQIDIQPRRMGNRAQSFVEIRRESGILTA